MMKKPIQILAEDAACDSMDGASIDDMAACLKLLGDRTRLTIIALLKQSPLCVCDIAAALGTSQPNVSQHLKKMKAAGLLEEHRKGQWIYYSICEQNTLYLQAILAELPSIGASINQSACE